MVPGIATSGSSQSFLLACLAVSVGLQASAAVLALRLIGVTGRRKAWILVSLAIALMAVRRVISFSEVVSGRTVTPQDLVFEVVGLATSVLMFAGIALIRPLFLTIRRSEAELRELSEERRLILENTRDIVYRHDRQGVLTYLSPEAERITGYAPQEQLKHFGSFLTDHPGNAEARRSTEEALRTGREQPRYEIEIKRKDGTPLWLEVVEKPYFSTGRVGGIIGIARDISRRKRDEAERERLITELREASSKIRVLRGFLPICASCKKIRDDKGYWNQLEAYIRDHSEAEFSHGLCPDCAARLYPTYHSMP